MNLGNTSTLLIKAILQILAFPCRNDYNGTTIHYLRQGVKLVKVLQINKLYYPEIGGIEQVVQQIAEGLNGRIEMKVLVCNRKGKTLHERINGVELCRAASIGVVSSMPVSLSFFHHYKMMAKNCDIIHIHMPFPLADLAVALFGFKGKVVLSWHSDVIRQRFFLKLYRPVMRKLLKRADAIVAATQGHIDGSDYLPKYENKCVLIPYGIRQMQRHNYVRSKTSDGITILFVGRLVYYKGCDILLEAFSKVTGAKLRIAGQGNLEDSLKKKAEGISNEVCFLGNISDEELANEYRNCDFLVLSSVARSEAFGLVQIEAMSYGKPVINTYLPGGVPYVSLDNVTGLTVPPFDADALAGAMQRLIDDEDLRLEFGQNAYKRAREEFSEQKMLDSVLALYESLLANNQRAE